MISNVRADRFNRSYIASLDADLAHYSQPAHFNPLRGKLNRRLGRFGPFWAESVHLGGVRH